MGRFADDSVYSNAPSPTTGAGLAILASNQRAILELPGAQAPQLVTIADGAIIPTGAFLRVDTEGQAAADDLTIINVTISDTESLHDGMIVYLQAADSGRVVTIKNTASAGGITTYDGQDVVLDTTSWLVLQLRQGTWYEMRNLFDKTLKDVADSKTTAAEAAHAAMPNWDATINFSSLSQGASWQALSTPAPADGYLRVQGVANASGGGAVIGLRINGRQAPIYNYDGSNTAMNFVAMTPVNAGDTFEIFFKVSRNSASTDACSITFIYAYGTTPTI